MESYLCFVKEYEARLRYLEFVISYFYSIIEERIEIQVDLLARTHLIITQLEIVPILHIEEAGGKIEGIKDIGFQNGFNLVLFVENINVEYSIIIIVHEIKYEKEYVIDGLQTVLDSFILLIVDELVKL